MASGTGGADREAGRKAPQQHPQPDVVLGEDWVAPDASFQGDIQARRDRHGLIAINRSPLARKIITYNLLAILVLVAGVLYLNPFRDSLVYQREIALVSEAELMSEVITARLEATPRSDAVAALNDLFVNFDPPTHNDVFLFDANGTMVSTTLGRARTNQPAIEGVNPNDDDTLIVDFLNAAWEGLARLVNADTATGPPAMTEEQAKARLAALVSEVLRGGTVVHTDPAEKSGAVFSVATPLMRDGVLVGAVAVTGASSEVDRLVRADREQILQMFVIAMLVSIGLSLVLASTIANPLSDLAAAAEIGQERSVGKVRPGRIRIPDLSARPDEIGRLSRALRDMVAALYDRIDANEQFAADVAHEIKNPLASLRSAVGTLRVAKKPEHQLRLLDVIDHDVRRLDRLVSDISNASRLDSELVREEEEAFDLLNMIRNLAAHLALEAKERGVDFITDLPPDPIIVHGLEARLAQVFVNLVSNATSFCEEGDAIRVWARRRENRVLVVVEDTGPGIPEEALGKIFNRFYSQRPESQFGNNSGLGLAISKQIVEAHGGVIWAENIRAAANPEAESLPDAEAPPLGARFVVGLPI